MMNASPIKEWHSSHDLDKKQPSYPKTTHGSGASKETSTDDKTKCKFKGDSRLKFWPNSQLQIADIFGTYELRIGIGIFIR